MKTSLYSDDTVFSYLPVHVRTKFPKKTKQQKEQEEKELLRKNAEGLVIYATKQGFPGGNPGTKSHIKAVKWLTQLQKKTFITDKNKNVFLRFGRQNNINIRVFTAKYPRKRIQIIIDRIIEYRTWSRNKTRIYSLAEYIYAPYHPTGFISLFFFLADDEKWNNLKRQNTPATKKIIDLASNLSYLLYQTRQCNAKTQRKLEMFLETIIEFRAWLPQTEQIERMYPIAQPEKLLSEYHRYLSEEWRGTLRSLYDVAPTSRAFIEFLKNWLDGDFGLDKPLHQYFYDWQVFILPEKPGYIKIKFRRDIHNLNDPNADRYDVDQIIQLPEQQAQSFLRSNVAIQL